MRDYRYRYSVRIRPVVGFHTPAGWPTSARKAEGRPASMFGKPNGAKLAAYVTHYNESLVPGGINAHIGDRGRAIAADIVDNDNGGIVVASWVAPAFEVAA